MCSSDLLASPKTGGSHPRSPYSGEPEDVETHGCVGCWSELFGLSEVLAWVQMEVLIRALQSTGLLVVTTRGSPENSELADFLLLFLHYPKYKILLPLYLGTPQA